MTDLENCTAVILAGGFGTRLQPIVSDRPKVLAEINQRPFLSYLLDQLADAGIRRAILCTGYKGEMVKACFGHTYRSIQLVYSQESSPLGTAGALKLAEPLFETDPVLVMNGDSYCQIDFHTAFRFHNDQSPSVTMALAKVADVNRFGQVVLNHDDRVTRFEEKGTRNGEGWINAGIYILSCAIFQYLPANQALSIERDVFPFLANGSILAYRCNGKFLDIGTPASFESASQFLLSIRQG